MNPCFTPLLVGIAFEKCLTILCLTFKLILGNAYNRGNNPPSIGDTWNLFQRVSLEMESMTCLRSTDRSKRITLNAESIFQSHGRVSVLCLTQSGLPEILPLSLLEIPFLQSI